jgi:competence protein ComGC
MKQSLDRRQAFTLIEVFAVIATLGIFTFLILPAMARTRAGSTRATCADNLKRIGLAFWTWENNHGSQYPMNVLNSEGGPPGAQAGQTIAAVAGSANAAPYQYAVFGVMSNELSTPKTVMCPSDERIAHTNFTMHLTGPNQVCQASAVNAPDSDPTYFNNFKVSYFLGVNASDTNPRLILAGDRNIWGDHNSSTVPPQWNGGGYGNINSTQYWMGTNWVNGAIYPAWSPSKMHQGEGNVLVADGSVQQLDSVRLRQQLSATGDTTTSGYWTGPNTLLFP